MKFLSLLFILFSISIFANDEGKLIFNGQTSDSISFSKTITETRYRTEMRDSTCTRQIPYEEKVCGYETRYRQECRFEPGRNRCWTEHEQQCRTVVRYRRQCSTSPGRQVCHDTPSRRECRTRADGRQICRDVPGRRVCRQEPGRQTCRDVPYNDRVCTSVPRQRCEWEPGRNICRDVPYQEYVCRMVTRYRSEDYACKKPVQIPYNVDVNVESEVDFTFKDQTNYGANVEFNFLVDDSANFNLNHKDLRSNKTFIHIVKDINKTRSGDLISIKGTASVIFLDKAEFYSPVSSGITNALLKTNSLSFLVGRVYYQQNTSFKVKIVRDGALSSPKTIFERELQASDLVIMDSNDSSVITLDFSKFGFELKNKKHEISIDVSIKPDSSMRSNLPERTISEDFKIKAE